VLCFLFVLPGYGQKTNAANNLPVIRCGTMQYYAEQKALDPLLEVKARAIAVEKLKQRAQYQPNASRPAGTQALMVIPVVFHVVGDAAVQSFASDEAIRRQLDVLNRDFAGLNPDTARLPPAFREVLAHSEIRFVLAKRTPAATTTNGIERRVTNLTFTSDASSYNTLLKHTAAGGLDQWDGSKYFNVWITNFTDGLLGIATFPNVNAPLDNEQGVALHFGSLDQPCGNPFRDRYDGGRTLVHETGHYLYLLHTWGDDGAACTGSDFAEPYGPLPGGCIDDTPNQASSTDGCLSGIQTDACTPYSPGIMYQNYMDYTRDACYGMFTNGQACRAEATLDFYRPGLLTSDGLVPVPGNEVNNDIRLSEILYPGSRGFTCGVTLNICSSPFNPQVLIVNDGDAPVTSLSFEILIDGISVATQSWAGNLQPGDLVYVQIDPVNSPAGTHTLTIRILTPNGQPDGRSAGNIATSNYTVLGTAITPPLGPESFEAPTFPPPGWGVVNENNGSVTWSRTTNAAHTGNAAAWLNGYDYTEPGESDYLVSPKLSTVGYDSLVISFAIAYAKYSDDPVDWESLEVVYSEDCGFTWKPTGYFKRGNDLVTNGGGFVTSAFTPAAGEWRTDTVKLGLCGVAGEITIGFKGTNAYGNNLYLDDIKFEQLQLPDPNVAIVSITDPNGLYCSGTIGPTVVLQNKGNTDLNAVTIHYSIDGGVITSLNWTGNLPRCSASVSVSLPPVTVPAGNHTITFYTSAPNGVADKVTSNDTLIASFSVVPLVPGPVVQGFEEPAFPPLNWSLQNFDNQVTWTRTTDAAKAGIASMVIRNFDDTSVNTLDRFVSPRVSLGTIDSAFVSFDYAYQAGVNDPTGNGLPLDTLELVLTTDCGLTTTTLWKKWGEELQTVVPPNQGNAVPFKPTPGQWRSERIEISPLIGSAGEFQVYFIMRGNQQNNLYIDNINIFGKILPARLKRQGYLVYPIPFQNAFRIHHLVQPTDLQAAQVFNAAGQLVWDKRFNGNANTETEVDLKNMAAGVYILKMVYTNRTILERIVKH
jgi:hypothetical protein